MGTSNCKKFRLLLWKNYILQKRNPAQAIVQILLPLVFAALLLLLRMGYRPMNLDQTAYSAFNPLDVSGTNLLRHPEEDSPGNSSP